MTDLELEVLGKYAGKWKFFTTKDGVVELTGRDVRICRKYIKFVGEIFFDRELQEIVVKINEDDT